MLLRRSRRYTLGSKPGKENTKERGELEVKIGFIVKAGSLTDLTRKERHKSSLGQLSTAAQSIGGSLLSIGSLEKRKGLKKFAKSIGNKVKGKSKSKLDKDELDEREEHHIRPSRQAPGEADPGVISEDEDEFTVRQSGKKNFNRIAKIIKLLTLKLISQFDDLSHKSSASSLNAPVGSVTGNSNYSPTVSAKTNFTSHVTAEPLTTPPAPTNAAPNKPPRFSSNSPNLTSTGAENQDEWGRKLYGKQPNSVLKR